jgi:hypothetical protein
VDSVLVATVLLQYDELLANFAFTSELRPYDEISCLTLSADGRFLASGQITYMGFTADIIVWDLASRTMVHRMAGG